MQLLEFPSKSERLDRRNIKLIQKVVDFYRFMHFSRINPAQLSEQVPNSEYIEHSDDALIALFIQTGMVQWQHDPQKYSRVARELVRRKLVSRYRRPTESRQPEVSQGQ